MIKRKNNKENLLIFDFPLLEKYCKTHDKMCQKQSAIARWFSSFPVLFLFREDDKEIGFFLLAVSPFMVCMSNIFITELQWDTMREWKDCINGDILCTIILSNWIIII